MAITLRNNKSQALTFNEMDGNFTDLDGRATTLEGSTVQTINGISPTSNAITITTANITENTNLYYTDARARAAISVTAVSIKADSIDDTHIDFGTGTNQVSTADIPEQTNLYYTDVRADSRISSASVGDLSDVDITTSAPNANDVLTWNAVDGEFQPAAAPGAAGGEANTGSNVGTGSGVFKTKVGSDLQFKSIIGTDPIVATGNTNDITLTFSPGSDVEKRHRSNKCSRCCN
jgi:hypothetical protein